MTEVLHITDSPLPDDRNFHRLKAKGLEYVRTLAGNNWTNFNDSDPGITILDQLCYALTELGYCNNFAIEDILTDKNGKISMDGQFFQLDEVLTCSPVTLDDYRKLIIDRVPGVKNLCIELCRDTRAYQVFIHLNDKQTALLTTIDQCLNQHRNLGEYFHKSVILKPVELKLAGEIILTPEADVNQLNDQIKLLFDNYCCPQITQSGYSTLMEDKVDINDIYNGPRLKNGLIPASQPLPEIRQTINLVEIKALIVGLEGVIGFTGSALGDGTENTKQIEPDQVALLVFCGQFVQQNRRLADSDKLAKTAINLWKIKQLHRSKTMQAKVDLLPPMPVGTYRNISQYHSVQNTFPTIYGIGPSSVPHMDNDYRVAQSRQLKGYLMVFDQLLANQFSQLANIDKLFCFDPLCTKAPKPREQGKYFDGMPYQLFTPTYYCQPLYDVPNVKPLLKGHDSYSQQQDSWAQYKADPFNQYMIGLRQCMEDELMSDDRRNRMLDHLLARHGESGALYDQIITTTRWYGSELRTRVMVKALVLQNYQVLSYHRTKGYNFLEADYLLTPAELQEGLPANRLQQDTESLFVNGRIDQQKLAQKERVSHRDLRNFSTVELQWSLLLGLRSHYELLIEPLQILLALDEEDFEQQLDNKPFEHNPVDFRLVRFGNVDHIMLADQTLMSIERQCRSSVRESYQAHLAQLLWLSQQRRGFILVENALVARTVPQSNKLLVKLTDEKQANLYSCTILLPGYVELFKPAKESEPQTPFGHALQLLTDNYWPCHLHNKIQWPSFTELDSFIPKYVQWHNEIRSKDLSAPALAPEEVENADN